MTARSTATVFALLLTASCIGFAQPNGRGFATDIGQLRVIQHDVHHLGQLIDKFVHPAESRGFNPQPDPPGRGEKLSSRIGMLLPAVQKMLNFSYEQTGDRRYLELLRLLEELQELIRQYEAAGDGSVRTRLAEQMAVDMFRIESILKEIEGELIGLL